MLSEDSNVISTLSQLFTLPAGSTHLRFTLLDVNLQSNGTNRPPDAFEVALLEASTLTPLAGVVSGLTQTDSLLNIQADGTIYKNSRVTLTPFSLQPHSLSGVTLDPATGLLSWAVPRTQTVGLYTIAVTVTDAGTPALSETRSVTIDVLELSNTAPTLDPIGPKTVNEETELRFTISASDVDLPAQTLVYGATGLPPGATFDPTTRELVWTPAEDQGGANYQVTFSVTDGELWDCGAGYSKFRGSLI